MPKRYDTSYARGEFFQHLAAPIKPNVNEIGSTKDFYGNILKQSHAYGCVRTEDGHMFELLRAVKPTDTSSQTSSARLVIQSTEVDGQNLQFDMMKMKNGATSEGCSLIKEGDTVIWRKGREVPGADWEIRISEKNFVWKEDGIFSFTGPILNPGVQWYLPGPEYGTFYVNFFVPLEGQILGRKASGFICFDQLYMHPEGFLYFTKDIMMNNKGHILWYMWGTVYDNGSMEWGQFIVGNDRMGFGFYANSDRTCVITTDNIDATISPPVEGDDPWTGRIELTLDGENWEFLPDPRGRMPGMLKKEPPTPQREGRWQRVGETRKPVAWFAWGETEFQHGLTRQTKLPTRI